MKHLSFHEFMEMEAGHLVMMHKFQSQIEGYGQKAIHMLLMTHFLQKIMK